MYRKGKKTQIVFHSSPIPLISSAANTITSPALCPTLIAESADQYVPPAAIFTWLGLLCSSAQRS